MSLSVETVRQLLLGEGLWKAKSVRRPEIHQLRERRARLGELVQIDGSPHDWFEGRAPKCTLLVFVDDARRRGFLLTFSPMQEYRCAFKLMAEFSRARRPRTLVNPA